MIHSDAAAARPMYRVEGSRVTEWMRWGGRTLLDLASAVLVVAFTAALLWFPHPDQARLARRPPN